MPSSTIPFSPAELSYLYTSLTQNHTSPLRPDGREPTQFRPLVAETNLLPSANGSAKVSFAEGEEAVVGVKAEVQPVSSSSSSLSSTKDGLDDDSGTAEGEEDAEEQDQDWVDISIDIPGLRDDDSLPIFLAAMLKEALVISLSSRGDGNTSVKQRLRIGKRFRWKIYIDIFLLSSPLSYPLPLLSMATHLALRSTRLPLQISSDDDDPLFDDDWDASTYLYPPAGETSSSLPPVTLLVMVAGENLFFDPSTHEIAVADSLVAVSIVESSEQERAGRGLKVLAMRSIDPPARLTAAGVPMGTGAGSVGGEEVRMQSSETKKTVDVWRPPRGGVKRGLISRIIQAVVKEGGVGYEVLDGLRRVEA